MNIKNLPNIIEAIVLGAVVTYFFDPVIGRRRRALARDKLVRLQKATQEAGRVAMRDLKNRTRGTIAERRTVFFGETVDDTVLAERVRSKLGFLVRNPSSIDVQASDGKVTLVGPVFTDEVQQLIDGVKSVRGVHHVENLLAAHEIGDNVPGLQSNAPRPTGQSLDVFQRRWAPSTRFLLGLGGIALLFELNFFRRSAAGLAMLASLAFLARRVAEEEHKERKRSDWRNEVDAPVGWS